ncbi:MAG: hypothetical protein IKS51_09030 [Erysipelotrichaceae bacterium]|nr:hypothetical protein [Erysipelotrichaceae bacterium]
MNDKHAYLSIEEVKTEGQFLKAICFKPKAAPIIMIIVGILMFIPRILLLAVLGLFFIVMSVLVLFLVKDFKVMDIFDKGVLFYGDKEAKLACFIPFDDIRMWTVKRDSGHDTAEFTLQDGSMIIKDSFEVDKAYRTLYGLIKEKEEKYMKAQKARENQLSIPDALENIRNRFFKK